MRILLLGEYSGFFKNLKSGLLKLGHEVTLLANGDEFKQIKGADAPLNKNLSQSFFKKVYRKMFEPFFDKRLYQDYDAVLLINTEVFYPKVMGRVLKKLKKHNKKVFLSSCGYDLAIYKAFLEGKFEYYMFENNYKTVNRFNGPSWKKFNERETEFKLIDKYIDCVIPTAYDYIVGYKRKYCPIILLPIDCDETKFNENKVNDKVVFFHGLNREEEKGTKYIVEALNMLKEKYPDDVEVIVDGKMPYDKYVQVMNKANVVLDQCKSYWYGMNAIIAMAQGKVVCSGARDESLAEVNISREECPVIEIKPNAEFIFKKLEQLVLHKEKIPELGRKSRAYVEKYHECQVVAQQYINVFNKEEEKV